MGVNGIIIFLLAFTFSAFTQVQENANSSAHLTFKGVPIDGTLSEYIIKMKNSGFKYISTEDGTAILQGDFASYNNCIVVVTTLKQKDLVSKITVMFPKWDTWSYLSSDYFSLQEMLTEKYGKPSGNVEEFQNNNPSDDGAKMYAVKFDKCKYYTTYTTENGIIQLSIEHDGVTSCFVMLAYYDKINGKIIKAKAMGDL
jgi:hypothetical protein